jgi:two-component system, NarL family, response regulator LiaR
MTDPIRIMLVDDHFEIHHALSAFNDIFDDLKLVAHASNGREAINLSSQVEVDVIIMDVIMPIANGIEATTIIHERNPNIKILALSSFGDEEDVRAMLNAGAVGYVLKNASVDDLARIIRTAYAGTTVFSPEITQTLLHPRVAEPVQNYKLTERELEVLSYVVKGLNNKEIAYKLTVSVATIKFHVSSIFAKLGVSSRVEAATLAVEKKLAN